MMAKIFADFHLHSKYSRATSNKLDLDNLEKWSRIKGLNLIGTGDFTHPEWFKELKSKLKDTQGTGILKSKTNFPFILQTEISLMYTQGGKGRRVHHLLLAPSLDVVSQITEQLLKHGRLDYDGRPIFGMSSIQLVDEMKQISDDIEIIPAHAWTPWFGILGSNSGFDSVEECFQEKAKHIHALETGLSSDPSMNWRLSKLDKYTLISNSDAHSFWPWKIGRECNIFDLELENLTYADIIETIRTRKNFLETIEFFPEEGKYHFDGHRNCNVCFSPEESAKSKNFCPNCGRPLTIGVAHRVELLADRKLGHEPKGAIPFRNVIPLSELIAGALKQRSPSSKKVWAEYNKLVEKFGTEFNVLLEATREQLYGATLPQIAAIVLKNREQKIKFLPGYDGEYGKPIFDETNSIKTKKPLGKKQKFLSEY